MQHFVSRATSRWVTSHASIAGQPLSPRCLGGSRRVTGARADGEIERRSSPLGRCQRLDALRSDRGRPPSRRREARGDLADINVLEQAFAGEPLPFDEAFKATGSWNCRTIKLGKLLPLVVYPGSNAGSPMMAVAGCYARCPVPSAPRGVSTRRTTAASSTSAPAPSTTIRCASTTMIPFNEVAIVERLGKRRLVFQFPEPQLESLFDILVLER